MMAKRQRTDEAGGEFALDGEFEDHLHPLTGEALGDDDGTDDDGEEVILVEDTPATRAAVTKYLTNLAEVWGPARDKINAEKRAAKEGLKGLGFSSGVLARLEADQARDMGKLAADDLAYQVGRAAIKKPMQQALDLGAVLDPDKARRQQKAGGKNKDDRTH